MLTDNYYNVLVPSSVSVADYMMVVEVPILKITAHEDANDTANDVPAAVGDVCGHLKMSINHLHV